ncbi:cysteine desulfurase family protein [Planktosalinus lacus]|uniref:cysteine desulfurase n=1 Tax=Planktosalinus lacus TaxID=1526573 RepID=A0A8J2YAB2_9FLAO|nr:cysteine desulfurase family protein [Planktosalinus lacus]GGD92820.1 cysteine desulfurase [Planktosalinus lacus]
MKSVYFDSAATTQMRKEVIERITKVMQNDFGNPSSTHSYGRASKSLIENARKTIANELGVTAAEIIFTSGGTEADNLILNSCVRDLGVNRIITTQIEHHAVLHTIEELHKNYEVEIDLLTLDSCGEIDYDQLESFLKDSSKKTLISLMHVNNEVGTMLDLDRVSALSKKYNALFHSDTVQSIGHFRLNLSEVKIDFITAAAHKFHGPKGVGFAFIRKNTGLQSLIFGGQQERGLRAGTEAVHNIAGLETAFQLAYEHLEEEKEYILSLKDYFIETLKKEIQGVKFNGACSDNAKSTYTLLNVCLPISPQKALMLLFQLDLKGIACSKGSACQSGSDQGSHVLNAILNEEDRKKPSIRFSFSLFNTKEEVDYVVQVLKEFIEN